MPLPILLPSNTARYKVSYTVGGHTHTQEIRAGNLSPAALGQLLVAYWGALGPLVYETVVNEVSFAPNGSTFFNPVSTGVEGTMFGSGQPAVAGENAYFFDFVGRTSGGRRMRFFQYGAKNLGGDFRFVAGENASLDAALDVIRQATTAWLGIDGIKPVMKSYINAGVNAYWQRNLRP